MCVPCKEIINSLNSQAAETLSILRDAVQTVEQMVADGEDFDNNPESDFLFRMAVSEVAHIRAVRELVVEFARDERLPKRWRNKLMECYTA